MDGGPGPLAANPHEHADQSPETLEAMQTQRAVGRQERQERFHCFEMAANRTKTRNVGKRKRMAGGEARGGIP